MSAYKDDQRGTWFAKFCYKDWQGEKKWITSVALPPNEKRCSMSVIFSCARAVTRT